MMGLFNQAGAHFRHANVKPRGSAEDDRAPSDTEPDDTSILSVLFTPPLMISCDFDSDTRDEDEGSIITSLISQLRRVLYCDRHTEPRIDLDELNFGVGA
jgi:hypothetical protein